MLDNGREQPVALRVCECAWAIPSSANLSPSNFDEVVGGFLPHGMTSRRASAIRTGIQPAARRAAFIQLFATL